MKNHIKNCIKIMGLAAVPFGTVQAIDYEIKVTQEYKCDPNDPKSEKDGAMHFAISVIEKDGKSSTEHSTFFPLIRGDSSERCAWRCPVYIKKFFYKKEGTDRFICVLEPSSGVDNIYVSSDVPTVGVGHCGVYASDNEIFDIDIRRKAACRWNTDLIATYFVYKKNPIRGEPCVIRGSGCFWDSVLARWDPMERKVIFNAGHVAGSVRDQDCRDKLRGADWGSKCKYIERELQKEVNNVETFREAFRCAQAEMVEEEHRLASNSFKVLYKLEKERCKRLKAELEEIKGKKTDVNEIKEEKK